MLSPGGNTCVLQIRPIVHVTSLFGYVDSILKVVAYLSVAELSLQFNTAIISRSV